MNAFIPVDLRFPSVFKCKTLLIAFFCAASVTCNAVAKEYVLLNNGNVIEGTATSIGPHVIIDRGDGNELRLDARQVAHSASSLIELYRFRCQQCQYPNVASYQDDARWCFRHQLFVEMEDALDAADSLDPTHPETFRLRRQLASVTSRISDTGSDEEGSVQNQLAPAAGQAVISMVSQKVKRSQAEEYIETELSKAGLSFQAVSYFSNRVQPLLINRCGNTGCHRSPSETKWELTHMGSHVRPPSRMTKINLLATLSIVNRSGDQASDLLTYATMAHGGRNEAPFKRGDQTSVDSLNEWIKEVARIENTEDGMSLTELPHLSDDIKQVATAKFSSESTQPKDASVRQVAYLDAVAPLVSHDKIAKPLVKTVNSAIEPNGNRTRPTRLPTVENPFDPEIFNRRYRGGAVANNRDK